MKNRNIYKNKISYSRLHLSVNILMQTHACVTCIIKTLKFETRLTSSVRHICLAYEQPANSRGIF